MSYSEAYDPHEGIAIVGMAGRFPGARNVAQLWRNLLRGPRDISRFRARRARAGTGRGHGGALESRLRAGARRS